MDTFWMEVRAQFSKVLAPRLLHDSLVGICSFRHPVQAAPFAAGLVSLPPAFAASWSSTAGLLLLLRGTFKHQHVGLPHTPELLHGQPRLRHARTHTAPLSPGHRPALARTPACLRSGHSATPATAAITAGERPPRPRGRRLQPPPPAARSFPPDGLCQGNGRGGMRRDGHRGADARRSHPMTAQRGPGQWTNSAGHLGPPLPARGAAAAAAILARTRGPRLPAGAVVRARRGGKRFEMAATAAKSWEGAAQQPRRRPCAAGSRCRRTGAPGPFSRREREVRRWSCAPLAAARAVQMEDAVERAEEKRRQSPSPPPSLGNGRPRRRSICLLVPWDNEPLVLPPGPDPGYPITAEIIEEERKAAQQRLRQLLGQKEDEVPSTSGEGTSLGTAIAQGSSGISRTWAASATTTSVVSGQADSSPSGLTDTSQPRSGSAPVLGGGGALRRQVAFWASSSKTPAAVKIR